MEGSSRTSAFVKRMSDAVYVIAELVAKPDKADDLRKLLVEFVAGARKEPGCKHYSLLKDPEATRPLPHLRDLDRSGRAPRPYEDAGDPGGRGPKLRPILAQRLTQQFMSMVSEG